MMQPPVAGRSGLAVPPAAVSPPPATAAGVQSSPTGPAVRLGDPSAPQPFWLRLQQKVKNAGNSVDQAATDNPRTTTVAGSIYEPYTYRVCAVNKSGRTCSDSAQLRSPDPRLDRPLDRVR